MNRLTIQAEIKIGHSTELYELFKVFERRWQTIYLWVDLNFPC